jgi:hypothetical protein
VFWMHRGSCLSDLSFWLSFLSDFFHSSGPTLCLLAGSCSLIWKCHKRLGQLSFDLFCRLISLDLIQGLLKLKFDKDLVCQPCCHGKMLVGSHSTVTKVITKRPSELLHVDTIGLARVRSIGGIGMCL